MNPLPLVLGELKRNRLAAAAIALLIALAVSLGVAVSAQERALRQSSAAAAEPFDVVVGMPGSQTQLVLTTVYLQPAALELMPGPVLQRLQGQRGIRYAAPIAFGDYLKGSPIVGSSADFLTLAGSRRLAEGRPFEKVHEAVVGPRVPLKLGDQFEPAHGAPHAGEPHAGEEHHDGDDDDDDEHVHHGFKYTVVGRLSATGSPWDNAIIVPVEAVWLVHGLSSGHPEAPSEDQIPIGPPWIEDTVPGVPAVVIKADSVADAYRLRSELRRGGTTALFPAEVLLDLYSTLGDARDLLAMVSVATQGLVIAAVLLAVFAVLAARRQQLAVLRALGASRGYLFLTVWLQVMVMISAGAVIGLGLGWAGAGIVSLLFETRTGLVLSPAIGGPELLMVSALLSVGALLAAVPATIGYRQPVAEGLRG